jgi:hypothetical protein
MNHFSSGCATDHTATLLSCAEGGVGSNGGTLNRR